MRVENARLGVETTTRKGLTARSATKPRSSSSIAQWRTARPERTALEKVQQAGPRLGSSSTALEKVQQAGPRLGSSSVQVSTRVRMAQESGRTHRWASCRGALDAETQRL